MDYKETILHLKNVHGWDGDSFIDVLGDGPTGVIDAHANEHEALGEDALDHSHEDDAPGGTRMKQQYLITEFQLIEAEDIEEAKARAGEGEGDVIHVAADPTDRKRVVGFDALHFLLKEMDAGHVVMTPEDIRTHVEQDIQNAEDFDEDTEFEGLDVDVLVNRALQTSVWNKGFSNSIIMESTWDVVAAAASQAAVQMRREQE